MTSPEKTIEQVIRETFQAFETRLQEMEAVDTTKLSDIEYGEQRGRIEAWRIAGRVVARLLAHVPGTPEESE